ncbi:hypothetical protein [Olleya sp. R77988]|uniref:hypothetical protein n=1 Tax=Olleya sp. R77988 TaxID=3093875 RepID=UPI0037CB2918
MSIEVPIIILIIAIPTYFVMRWLLKKIITEQKTLKTVTIICTVIIAPVLYVCLVLAFFSYLFYEPQYDFNKEKWAKNKNKRYEMRDDLIESEILKDKSKTEIFELIGNPDNIYSDDIWIYNLGISNPGLGLQFNSLELSFKNERIFDFKKIEVSD